jgi:hypothetical protein
MSRSVWNWKPLVRIRCKQIPVTRFPRMRSMGRQVDCMHAIHQGSWGACAPLFYSWFSPFTDGSTVLQFLLFRENASILSMVSSHQRGRAFALKA